MFLNIGIRDQKNLNKYGKIILMKINSILRSERSLKIILLHIKKKKIYVDTIVHIASGLAV